jgi:hypothetical protein
MFPQFNTIYQFYSDEVARLATITVESGAVVSPVDPDYAPASLVDDNPAKVAKIDDTSGAWLFEYASAQRIDLAALIHHNFDESTGSPGVSVRLEANTSNSWGAPPFSATFTIPPWFSVGTRRWPVNPWLDLTQATGYTTTGYRYWRLVVDGNSQDLQLGEVWFGSQIRRFEPNDLKWGLTPGAHKPQIENRTSFEISTTYSRGTTVWRQEADLMADDTLAAELERHWYDVEGRARPWLLIPSGPIDDDRAYLVRYATTDRQMQWNWENANDMRLAFQEVGRGLRPGV